jgi:hypothetical protein
VAAAAVEEHRTPLEAAIAKRNEDHDYPSAVGRGPSSSRPNLD